MKKKVLFAEDHAIVIRGMKIIFETEFSGYELDIVCDTSGLMNNLKANEYQLAIIDLQLQDGDTLHLLTEITSIYPNLAILIYTANPEELYAQRLYILGIKGYLCKQTGDSEIIFALTQLLEGKTYISETFKRFLLAKGNSTEENPFHKLSQREMEVLNLMLKGMRTSEMCAELNLQPSTVATYKAKIFAKLAVNNLLELKKLLDNFDIRF